MCAPKAHATPGDLEPLDPMLVGNTGNLEVTGLPLPSTGVIHACGATTHGLRFPLVHSILAILLLPSP